MTVSEFDGVRLAWWKEGEPGHESRRCVITDGTGHAIDLSADQAAALVVMLLVPRLFPAPIGGSSPAGPGIEKGGVQ